MASSVSGQDKPNPALWLAGKIELSCLLLGLSAVARKKNSPESHITEYILYWLSLNCSVKMAGYWPHSFFLNLWTSTHNRTLSQSTNNVKKKELGQYPTILTSHLVDNPYVVHCQSNCIIFIMSVLPCHSRNRCKPRANCRQATNRHRIL